MSQHAYAYGGKFGEVQRVSIKWGSGAQPYAILNFKTADSAAAAIEHSQKPVFKGTTVNPSAWKLPGLQPLSGGLLHRLLGSGASAQDLQNPLMTAEFGYVFSTQCYHMPFWILLSTAALAVYSR